MHSGESEADVANIFKDVARHSKMFETTCYVVIVMACCFGAVIHVYIRSPLWLDEALTISIAREPVSLIPHYLKHDGAPPLFYVMLHFWLYFVSDTQASARYFVSLIGLANIPVVYFVGKKIEDSLSIKKNRSLSWTLIVLILTSPFDVYYSTDVRMYGLLILLTGFGIIALLKVQEKPTVLNVGALSLVTGLLLYSHYWALYLIFVVGLGLAIGFIISNKKREIAYSIVGIVIGCLTFIPWLPIFMFQTKHTGTPWAKTTGFAAVIHTVTQFAGGPTTSGRLVALIYFFIIILSIFGMTYSQTEILLNLKTVKGVRAYFLVFLASLILALVGGIISKSTYSDRYTSIVFLPLLVVVAYGFRIIGSNRIRVGAITAVAVCGAVASWPNAVNSRSESQLVASYINSKSSSGSLVIYCPDQLGPAVSELVTANVRQYSFPNFGDPHFVDWVDYAARNRSANVDQFVNKIIAMANSKPVFFVWEEGYLTFGTACETIAADLQARYGQSIQAVSDQPLLYYEHEHLSVYGNLKKLR